MNEPDVSPGSPTMMPYQRAFVDTIFESGARRIHVLHAEVGSGKGTALIECVVALHADKRSGRVLIVALSSLSEQYAERLRMRKVPVLPVDRYRFREMTDNGASTSVWPEGTTSIVSIDFAKQADVRASLESLEWDLVIVDVSPMVPLGARWEVMLAVAKKAGKVVIATGLGTPAQVFVDAFDQEEIATTYWRRTELRDQSGRNIAGPPPVMREVTYNLSPVEMDFVSRVEAFCGEIDKYYPKASFSLSGSLRRQLESSPAAIESGLRRFSSKAFMASTGSEDGEIIDNHESDEPIRETVDHIAIAELSDTAMDLVTTLEGLAGDSKLAAFSRLCGDLSAKSAASIKIVILTKYLSTLFYLSVALEDLGISAFVLHGGMDFDDRQSSLLQYQTHGGVLLATHAITRGTLLPNFSDLVLYEIPESSATCQQVAGMANMIGRYISLNVWVLASSNFDREGVDSKLLALRQYIARVN